MADSTPIINRLLMEKEYGGYIPPSPLSIPQGIPFKGLDTSVPNFNSEDTVNLSPLERLRVYNSTKDDPRLKGGGIPRSLSEISSPRYPGVNAYSDYNNEDAYGQGQAWSSKMVSGVGKGLLLTGTTFLQTTVGALNGLYQWGQTGKASSFYDNELNKWVDDINKKAEDKLPNYYTDAEKDAHWYAPSKIFSANFLWDGIVKNLGFSTGAAASGMAFSAALRALPLTSRLFSIGKSVEALAATEKGLMAADKAAGSYGELKGLYDQFISSYKVLNPGGRALVAGLSTSGEASFEAYQNMNDFRNKLIDEYKQMHEGQEPIGINLESINKAAEGVGNSSYLLNVALLSATNYIQFPKILGSTYKGERSTINAIARETDEIIEEGGKYIAKPPLIKNAVLRNLNRVRPYLFSTSEAFEEGSQFAVTKGTQDYYDKAYKGDAGDVISSLVEGVKQTLTTDEGMENVLIGGLSGALMLATGRYQERSDRQKNTKDALSSSITSATTQAGLNTRRISDFTKETLNSVKRGVQLQEERESLLKNGDVRESKDIETDYMINYLAPRIKFGRFDLVKSDIEEYRQLASTDEGFAQLQAEGKALESDTREAYLQRLGGLESTAENMKTMYEGLHLRYGAMRDEKGKPLYSSAVMDKMVYAAMKVADYDVRIPKLIAQVSSLGIDVNQILKDVVSGNTDSYNKAIAEIDANTSLTDDQKIDMNTALEDAAHLSTYRDFYLKEYGEIQSSPKKFQEVEAEVPVVKAGEPIPTVKVKTKKGEKDVEIGTEYFLGRVVKYDKDGNPVYRAPRITIIGETEDGKIKIKDSTGKVHEVSPEELEDYNLARVDTTLSNKKAKFFMDNWNKEFEFNFGKGRKQRGRLEYSDKEGTLLFIYKDNNGKLKQIEVTGDQFKAKKGYKNAMITPVGEYTPAQQQSLEEMSAQKDERIQKKREGRLNVLEQLFDESAKKQREIEDLLSKKKGELNNIKEQLIKLKDQIERSGEEVDKRYKAVKFKSAVQKAMTASLRLSRMQEQLENEIRDLEIEKDDTDMILETVTDMAENIDLYPTSSKEFLEELNEEILNLEILAEETVKQISSLGRLVDEVKNVLDKALGVVEGLVRDYIERFPYVTSLLGEDLSFIPSKALPVKPSHLTLLEDFIATVEDNEIKPNTEKLENLTKNIESFQETLKRVEDEIRTKQQILSKFEKIAQEYKQQKEEEAQITNDNKLLKEALGTEDKSSTPTRNFKEGYEAVRKKAVEYIWRSTMGVLRGKPHQVRANNFGFNLEKFDNRKNIRGIYVTSKNEERLGLKGLMDHLRTTDGNIDEDIDKDQIIALVMVDVDGNLLGENGQPLTDEQKADSLNNAVYQVFPLSELRWSSEYDNESMFRKDTPEEVKSAVLEQFAQWRERVIDESETNDDKHEIGASFGIPKYAQAVDDKGNPMWKDKDKTKPVLDYNTRTSVQDAGLVNDDDFYGDPLILIPTLNDFESKGTTGYNDAKGRPFLELPNAISPLMNRKHTSEEAENIFNAIVQMARYMMDKKIGIKSDQFKQLETWVKSVVYWGRPETREGEEKPLGYNSVFWEKDNETGKFMLIVSGQGQKYIFTPTELERNKHDIILLLENMYNNINSSMVKDVSNPYEEIISVSPDGKIKSRTWLNYQAYLLSNKFIPADEREEKTPRNKDIPLSTVMLPVKTNEVNRTGIYFYTVGAEEFDIPEVAPKVKVTAGGVKNIKPVKGEKTFERNGKTIIYTINDKGEITILPKGDSKEILDTTKKNIKKTYPELSDKDIDTRAKASIKKVIQDSLGVKPKVEKPAAKPVAKQIEEEDEDYIDEDTYKVTDEDTKSSLLGKESDDDTFEVLREKIETPISETEDWTKLEKWLKSNFPNVPVYRVKNIIKATNGKQAWGMFHKGAIYVYENAETGTGYHEVFEAIWKMFSSPEEQQSVIGEFKQRRGRFIDRPTGEVVNYSEATPFQIKEQLAEEFRDYVQYKKIPPKPASGRPWILKLFADLITFIKSVFINSPQSKIEEMFQNINQGKYRKIPYTSELSFANKGVIDIDEATGNEQSEYSLVGISDKKRSDIIQHMTFLIIHDAIKDDESLFNVVSKKKSAIYADMKKRILDTIKRNAGITQDVVKNNSFTAAQMKAVRLMENVSKQWNEIISRHEEYLKGYQIEFDENDNLQITDENKIKESDYVDANKVDNFKKTSAAIKLLLSTLVVVDNNEKYVPSTIGGVQLIPISETYIKIMNKLHNARSVEDMLRRLNELAEYDPNYRTLYKRITKRDWFEDKGGKQISLDGIKTQHSLRLLASFWATFKKAKPGVKNVYILENGDIAVGDANLSTIASQRSNEYLNAIIAKAKDGSGYFTYDEKRKVFVGNTKNIENIELNKPAQRTAFLKKLGIDFKLSDVEKLTGENEKKFNEAVAGIRKSISEGRDIASFSKKVLSIHKRLLQLGEVEALISHPEFDSTFFNINHEKTQTYIGTNPATELYEFLSQIEKFDQANVGDTQYSYLLTDVFSKGSSILKRMFTPDGKRNNKNKQLLEVVYVGGTDNQIKGKQRESAKLSYKERLVQELNLNIKGYYLNLVPGDASMEWAIFMDNAVSFDTLDKMMANIKLIFREYFISELDLAKDNRKYLAKGRAANEMRFFKSILGEELHKKVINEASDDSFDVYKNNEKEIDAAIRNFILSKNKEFQKTLEEYGVLKEDESGYQFENVAIEGTLKENELNNHLTFLNVNFMISNIELHKLLYADPYQYADELKRIKNFNSPRQALINNSPKMNDAFNRIWNKGFKKNDIGWTDFMKDYFRSVTHKDVMAIVKDIAGYSTPFKGTDGGGVITYPAYRNFRIRVGNWNDNEESQYKHDIEYEKLAKSGATAEELAEFNKANPKVRSAYTPIKPIVSGNKANGNNYNDILLDKFALYPISYRLLSDININGGKTDSNAITLYNKMQNEKIDYAVFDSSRKVGAIDSHSTYNKDGSFNTTPYSKESIINVPFAIMSVQTEVPSKDDGSVTRGSQATKLVTMDYMDAGVPVDFMPDEKKFDKRYNEWYKITDEDKKKQLSPLYKEIKHNEELLGELMEVGYQNLLTRLGIKEENGKYSITDFSKAAQTLRDEILKREVNDNISDALQSFIDGNAILEATPAYHQVRNILYSIADKEIISPKINGGMRVLIPVDLLESVKAENVGTKENPVYESKELAFYSKSEDGKTVNVCEIMIARWFDSDMSDAELLDYLNNTEEGQKILSGFAFRIPTQKQNSMEVFKVKQFLPREFGDSVILPTGMVNKSGGDFDIDKLTIYLKNVMQDINKNIKLVELHGDKKSTIEYYKEQYQKDISTKLERITNKDEFRQNLLNLLNKLETATETRTLKDLFPELTEAEEEFYTEYSEVIRHIMSEAEETDTLPSERVLSQIKKKNISADNLISKLISEETINSYAQKMYKYALQNEYIQSLQTLTTNPLNFDRLVKPNSADQLKALGEFIAQKTVGSTFDYKEVGNMIDRNFMSRLRHAFVSGKYAIGIAAVNQTNNSLNQRQPIYIDPARLENVSDEDRKWLGDALIKFDKYNKITINGKSVATLSMIKNAEGQDISDIIAQFIDGYVDISKGPWIMELGATPNVSSTFMFLAKIGVPIDTVAYFMNQPIIRDYLRSIETAGYSWLFMDSFAKEVKGLYESGRETKSIQTKIPSKSALKALVEKKAGDLNAEELEQQQFILDEFLKYAKMSEQMFHVTQGSNFDTANFNDPYLVFKKFEQLKKAQQTIISSVDDLLENSFVGKLGKTIQKMRNSLATILKSDQQKVRKIIEQVLLPYVNMSDRDFVKLAQKAVSDLFDYAVQTDQKLNRDVVDILVNDGGVGAEVQKLMNEIKRTPQHGLYQNYIVGKDGILQYLPSGKADGTGVNNIKIKGLGNKVYDQNNIIYGFREIKEWLKKHNQSALYDRIVQLAVLQSGLSYSSLSFTSVLPQEDFEKIYNKTLSKLAGLPLKPFVDLSVFQRNNHNNDDIVPHKKARLITSKKSGNKFYNLEMSFKYKDQHIQNAIDSNQIPQLLKQRQNDREANFDHIVYSWEKNNELLPDNWRKLYPGKRDFQVIKEIKKQMRDKGDYSYIQKGLFEKVKDASGKPLETGYTNSDGDWVPQFVYKAINAWGDGQKANEFYDEEHKSVLDNGFIKVDGVANQTIINIFGNKNIPQQDKYVDIFEGMSFKKKELLEDYSQSTGRTIGEREYTPENIQSLKPNEIFVFGSNEGSSKGGKPTHGAGAALLARQKFGAIQGQSRGLQGQSYAIVTKKYWDVEKSSTLAEIFDELEKFNQFAYKNKNKKFLVTKLGSSLAGYKINDIKQLFEKINNDEGIPDNVVLPKEYEVRERKTEDWKNEDNNCPVPF